MNTRRKPKAAYGGGDFGEDEKTAGNLPLLFDYSTYDAESQPFDVARALRLRDAIIALERQLLEARIAFEIEIAEALKGGAG